MFGTEKSEELKQLLQKLNIPEIGIFFEMNKNEMISCSCGHYRKVDERDIKVTERDRSGRIIKTYYRCPFCGTTAVMPYVDIEGSNNPVLYEPAILRDDGLFWVMALNVTWLYVDINSSKDNLSINETQGNDAVIVYDRKKKFLFVADYNIWHYREREWWKTCASLEYRDKMIYDASGEEITRLEDASYLSQSASFDLDYAHDANMAHVSKMDETIKLIAGQAGLDISSMAMDDSFVSLLNEIMLRVNIKWYDDYCNVIAADPDGGNLTAFGVSHNSRALEYYFEKKALGFDMEAETFEKAAGMPIEALKQCFTESEYQSARESMKRIAEYKLSDIAKQWLDDVIGCTAWDRVIDLTEATGADMESIIRHLHRAKENGFDASTVLSCYEEYLAKNMGQHINFNAAFTGRTYRQWELLTEKKMTPEQYRQIAERPTLDTFVKAMGLA